MISQSKILIATIIGLALIIFMNLDLVTYNKKISIEIELNKITYIVKQEYDSACIRKNIHLSGKGYTCNDLQKYLKKLGSI